MIDPTTQTFTPGIYVLTRDVENPHPDRRTRHDWQLATGWKKGTRFVITVDTAVAAMAERNATSEKTLYRLHPLGCSASLTLPLSPWLEERLPEWAARTRAICEALVPETLPITPFDWWVEDEMHSDNFLAEVLAEAFLDGKVDLAYLRAVEKRLFDRAEAKHATPDDAKLAEEG